MAEPGVARSNGSATLLHVGKIQIGQLIRLRVGHVLEPRPTRILAFPTVYFSIKSTIDVALAWIELTCGGESTSLSLNIVRTVSS
jgi:hypothetical protein